MIGEFEKLKNLFNQALNEMIADKYQTTDDIKKITFCNQLSFEVFEEKPLENKNALPVNSEATQ